MLIISNIYSSSIRKFQKHRKSKIRETLMYYLNCKVEHVIICEV